MRSLKNILRSFAHAPTLPTAVWEFTSITSCARPIRPSQAAASAQVPLLETKIFIQSDERPGFEYAAFEVPEPYVTILGALNGAQIGASPRRRNQGTEITLTAMSSSRQHI